MNGNLLRIADLDPADVETILDLAERPTLPRVLDGRGAALVFEHPSTRTRNAAEMAVVQLGGHPVTIRGDEIGFDVRESVEDVAMTLACFHSLIGARVARHGTLERIAARLARSSAGVPVVNLLSDVEHPTQALADLLTIRQSFGKLEGVTVAFIGDGNNVARSLASACALVGARFRIASPVGHALFDADVVTVESLGGTLERFDRPEAAAEGADVFYSDVWVSMGEEPDGAAKRGAFAGFSIDDRLVECGAPNAIFLHCLPAHRGEEVSGAVIDGPRSQIWRQAENRMHALRGLFTYLLGPSS